MAPTFPLVARRERVKRSCFDEGFCLIRRRRKQQTLALDQGRWDREILLNDGDRYYEALIAAINEAKKSIDFEVYIFSKGQIGQKVVDAIIEASNRGVRVRVIVDGIGSSGWASFFGDRLDEAGVQFRVYHALPWEKLRRNKSPKLYHRQFFKLMLRINMRDHRKVQIFDDAVAFVGSFNITDEHSRQVSGERAWRDTAVQVEGEDVSILKLGFEYAWSTRIRRVQEWPQRRKKMLGATSLVRLNVRRRQREKNYRDLLLRIRSAKSRVWITNAYFIPDGSLVEALEAAGQAGIDVRILVPLKSDVFFIPWVSSAFQYGLLKAGVRVFQYVPAMLHAKTVLIDDWGLVGSSNLNHRSLFHDLEADVVLTTESSIAQLEEDFLEDLKKSDEATLENWYRRPWLERLAGRILVVFRNVM